MLCSVRHLDDPPNGLIGAQRVRNVRDRDELRPRPEQLREFVEQQLAAIVDRGDAQLRALFFAQHLPGHDVGVVLHGGDQDFVACADVLAAVGLRDQVDAFGGAADENNFAADARALRNCCAVRRAAS